MIKSFWNRHLLLLSGMIVFLVAVSLMFEGDFQNFYQSCFLWRNGFNPYNPAGYPGSPLLGFTYPPVAILTVLPFSWIPYGFALLAWTFVSILMLAAIIYVWLESFYEQSPSFQTFALTFASVCIPGVIWSFWLHQLTIPVLFAGSLAYHVMFRKNPTRPFLGGILCGFMLIKPHLALPALSLLLLRYPYKRKFIIGLSVSALLPIVLFCVSPNSNARYSDFQAAITRHAQNLYSRDEQGIPGALFKLLFQTKLDRQILERDNLRRSANFASTLPFVVNENKFKMVIFLITCMLWGITIFKWKQMPMHTFLALSFALPIWFGSYSHLYDGIMLLPLLILMVQSMKQHFNEWRVTAFLFYINTFLAFWLPFSTSIDVDIHWERVAWTSMFYTAGIFLVWLLRRDLFTFLSIRPWQKINQLEA